MVNLGDNIILENYRLSKVDDDGYTAMYLHSKGMLELSRNRTNILHALVDVVINLTFYSITLYDRSIGCLRTKIILTVNPNGSITIDKFCQYKQNFSVELLYHSQIVLEKESVKKLDFFLSQNYAVVTSDYSTDSDFD